MADFTRRETLAIGSALATLGRQSLTLEHAMEPVYG
jgi:hypothetical protein